MFSPVMQSPHSTGPPVPFIQPPPIQTIYRPYPPTTPYVKPEPIGDYTRCALFLARALSSTAMQSSRVTLFEKRVCCCCLVIVAMVAN